MSNTIHAIDFLEGKLPAASPVITLFGNEPYIQTLVKQKLYGRDEFDENSETDLTDDSEFAITSIDGESADWREVSDHLHTATLFGGDNNLVVISFADDFVKKFRGELEAYVARPVKTSCLVLCVSTWPANTKLFKAVDKTGLQIECSIPQIKRGRSKSRDLKKLNTWIASRAKSVYAIKISPPVANLLMELVDDDIGRMDQELAKLSLYVKSGQSISAELVEEVVGGWRSKTIWQAVEEATTGNTNKAVTLINQLIQSGEHPLALFGQLSWSLRRYGRVLELIEREERLGRKPNWDTALKAAGFQAWGGALESAKSQLKQLGRKRVRHIYGWLAETDLALKGTHSDAKRGQLVLEKLFARMSSEIAT